MNDGKRLVSGLAVVAFCAIGSGCKNDSFNESANSNRGVPSEQNTPSPNLPVAERPTIGSNPQFDRSSTAVERSAGANAVNGTPTAGMNTMARGGGPNHLADGDIAAITTALNQGEVQQAQLALTRAHSNEVRQFAQHMVMQHGQMLQQQSQLLGRNGLTPVDNDMSRQLQQQGQSVMQQLQSDTGPSFDRTYIDAQVREHQQALQTLDTQLIPNAQNPQFRQMLTDARTAVQQHLESARRIQQNLSQGGGSTPSGNMAPGSGGEMDHGAGRSMHGPAPSGTRTH